MDYNKAIAKAKLYLKGAEGGVCFVTTKGVLRKKLQVSDVVKYTISVNKGVLSVYDKEEKKEILSQKVSQKIINDEVKAEEKQTKTAGKEKVKRSSKLQDSSDEKLY